MYDLSILPKHTTPLIEPSSGQYLPVLTCHKISSRSSVNSTMACEHTRGSTAGCARGGALERGLRQGCMHPPLLFNIFFAVVINVAYTPFKVHESIMDALVHLRKEKGAGGRGEATAGESVLATPLCGMLYAGDAGVVSQPPEQPRKMMEVIVVVGVAFGLTVSEAKTEIICFRAKGILESIAIFNVETADQMYNQTDEFVYLGGSVNHNTDLSIMVDRRMSNAWYSFRKYTLELYDRPSAPLELKSGS